MAIDKQKIKKLMQSKKTIALLMIIAIMVYGVLSSDSNKKTAPTVPKVAGKEQIGTEEKLRAEIEGLRKTIEEMKTQRGTVDDIKKNNVGQDTLSPPQQPSQSIKELEKILRPIGKDVPVDTQKQQTSIEPTYPIQQPTVIVPRIIKIDIPESDTSTSTSKQRGFIEKKESSNNIYLPAGSFASFTLTSGAYAPESGQQMPVAGVIDKAYIGPNSSSINLKGCFFLGKAQGIVAKKIADIKPVKISCVWENGETFESDIAGYVTDTDGRFGLKGEVNRHAGDFFATVGITAFLEGFAAGVTRARESETVVAGGESTSKAVNIIGSAMEYGGFKGAMFLASAAKEFFSSQMKGLTPSVDVPPGARGYIYMTQGIKITRGNLNNANNINNYPYYYNLSFHK